MDRGYKRRNQIQKTPIFLDLQKKYTSVPPKPISRPGLHWTDNWILATGRTALSQFENLLSQDHEEPCPGATKHTVHTYYTPPFRQTQYPACRPILWAYLLVIVLVLVVIVAPPSPTPRRLPMKKVEFSEAPLRVNTRTFRFMSYKLRG